MPAQTGGTENEDLLHPVQSGRQRRRIAGPVAGSGPAIFTGPKIVRCHGTHGTSWIDDDDIILNQRRTGHSPFHQFRFGIFDDVRRPDPFARHGIQTVENAGGSQSIHAGSVNRRRGPGTGSTGRFRETNRICVNPQLLPRIRVVADDRFVRTALFLSEQAVSDDRKG